MYCRAGDRILVADDSNDDWWKVGITSLCYSKVSLSFFYTKPRKSFKRNRPINDISLVVNYRSKETG